MFPKLWQKCLHLSATNPASTFSIIYQEAVEEKCDWLEEKLQQHQLEDPLTM